MAKRGRRAKGYGKQLVTTSKLFKIEGLEETVAEIGRTIDRVKAERLKTVFVKAAIPIWSAVKHNIAALPISQKAKEMLDSMMMINQGKPTKANVLEGMSQAWGLKHVPKGAKTKYGYWRVWNPYWWEFGTRERKGPRGSIKPTPFFKPAVDANKDEVKKILIAGLKEVIEDIGK